MITFEEFKKLDLRIATIIEAKDHPNADRLYVLRVDVGGEIKQIVAGIRGQYGLSDIVGRKVVIINNLEPAVIRGEESQGMVLAASQAGLLTILIPEKDIPSGSPVR